MKLRKSDKSIFRPRGSGEGKQIKFSMKKRKKNNVNSKKGSERKRESNRKISIEFRAEEN